jgi:hypothetical protein
MNQPERKTKMYGKVLMASASDIYMSDQKKMQKQGWTVVSATEIGQGRLNVIYERGGAPQQSPALNVPNLGLLLGMLSPGERKVFDDEIATVVNRWLARKSQQ